MRQTWNCERIPLTECPACSRSQVQPFVDESLPLCVLLRRKRRNSHQAHSHGKIKSTVKTVSLKKDGLFGGQSLEDEIKIVRDQSPSPAEEDHYRQRELEAWEV